MRVRRGLLFVYVAAAMLAASAGRAAAEDQWLGDGAVLRGAWHSAGIERVAMKFPVGTLEVVGTTVGYAFHDRRAIESPLVRPR